MKRALLYLFYFALMQFFLLWAVYAAWLLASGESADYVWRTFCGGNAEAVTAPMLILASAVTSVAIGALFIWRRYADVSPAYLRSRQWGVFFWCALAAVGTIIPSAALQELMPALPDYLSGTFKAIMGHNFGYLTLCLLAPLVEEVVFRGAILRTLLRAFGNHWAAITVSALLFAVVHLNPAQMPHAFLMGLLLGWMYYRTGSILPAVAVHWVNNTVAYAFYLLFPYWADASLSTLFGGDTVRVLMAVGFSLLILLPSIYQLNMRMKTVDGQPHA